MHYRFGPFQLDLDRFSLSKEGEPVEVEPKVLKLLVYFLENHGRVISRDELVREVWGDDFVSDSAVSHAVYGLRRALGDDAKDPEFLRTSHGRGFEFLVGPSSSATGEPGGTASPDRHAGQRSGRGWAVVAGLLAVLAAGAWFATRGTPDPEQRSARPSRLLVLGVTTRGPDPEIQLLGLGVSDYLVRDLASAICVSIPSSPTASRR
jgi:DNA-binding winged helix-turn-helix (wHTH) protein